MTNYYKLWSGYLSGPSTLAGSSAGAACGWYFARSRDEPAPAKAMYVLAGAQLGAAFGLGITFAAPYLIAPVGFGYVWCRVYETRTGNRTQRTEVQRTEAQSTEVQRTEA